MTQARGRDLNRLIYHVLRVGILLSILFIAAGFLVSVPDPSRLPLVPLALSELPSKLARLSPAGLLGLGVILMILTPVARVFLSVLSYAAEGDRTYVLVTLVVLAALEAGMVLGLG